MKTLYPTQAMLLYTFLLKRIEMSGNKYEACKDCVNREFDPFECDDCVDADNFEPYDDEEEGCEEMTISEFAEYWKDVA